MRITTLILLSSVLLCLSTEPVRAVTFTTQWQLGAPGRGWPTDGVGGGADVDFVQEDGAANPLPGNPNSPPVNQEADDDYYFAGIYPSPIGSVASDELAMERAFAGIDNDRRVHFNLPTTFDDDVLVQFSFEANNLDQRAENSDPRYGVEVLFNGTLIMPEEIIRPSDLGTVFTSLQFTFGDVGAFFGPGGDNVLTLRGINYNPEGGGNWMGIDYLSLEVSAELESAAPEPTSLLLMLIGGLLALGAFLRPSALLRRAR